MNLIFEKATEKFIRSAEIRLRQGGMREADVTKFSDEFREKTHSQYEFLTTHEAEPTDLGEFMDDVLTSVTHEYESESPIQGLWSLRAEMQLEKLDRMDEGTTAEIKEFKKFR